MIKGLDTISLRMSYDEVRSRAQAVACDREDAWPRIRALVVRLPLAVVESVWPLAVDSLHGGHDRDWFCFHEQEEDGE